MSFKWRDNSIRILAVFIAILLWVYVTNEQNPVTDQTYTIPLEARDTPQGYVISGVPDTVSVKVRGTRVVVGTLQRDDFTAQVNLAGLKAGEQEVHVQVTAPPAVDVLQVSPRVLQVRADKIEQKNVPVVVTLRGAVAGGMQAGHPVTQPQVVTLRGPSSVLQGINRVGVTMDVGGATDTVERELPVETGIQGVTANPNQVRVTVPVTVMPVQSLPVRLRLTGEPAPGYQVDSTTVRPQTVQVTARDDILRNLMAVSTMKLDISGISGDVEREVVLVLPDGARSVEPDRVLVTVRVVPVTETPPEPPPEEENNTEPENR